MKTSAHRLFVLFVLFSFAQNLLGEITAVKLTEKFYENKLLADSTYKNQKIMVTGSVVRVTMHNGMPYIVLTGKGSSTVVCGFPKTKTKGLLKLKADYSSFIANSQ